MKTFVIAALAFTAVLIVEGQSGSSETAQLAPEFYRVRELGATKAYSNPNPLRVVTWNIDHGTDLDKIVAGITEHPCELCLLQEVDWNTARSAEKDIAAELAQRLGMNGAYAIEFEELSQERGHPAYIGQATLTRLPVLKSRILRFERQSGFWKPHSWIPSSVPLMQRRVGDRIALITELKFGGHLLVVYNAHLESRSAGPIQEHQLDEMLSDVQRYTVGTAILLGGDLNTKYLPSFFLHRLEAAGFHSALGEHIERTHRIAMSLDWLLVKGPVEIENGVVRRDIKGSDHYPVYATLAVR